MTDRQKQIYRLGQLYGYLCEKHGAWSCPTHDSYAASFPLKGFTTSLIAALRSEAVKLDDDYITYRASSINPEFPQGKPLSLDEQGIWTLGRLQIERDVKTLIDHTGLTQAQIAERLGVTALTVGRWYRGEVPPKIQARFELEEIALDKA